MQGGHGKGRGRVLTLSPHGPPPFKDLEVTNVPALELVDVADASQIKEAIKEGEAVVFTSKTGVRLVFEKLGDEALELLKGKDVVAIGPKTAAELEARGLSPIVPEEYHSGALAKLLKRYNKVVALRSDKASKTLKDELGDKLIEVVIYKTLRRPSPKIVEAAREADAVAVSSAEVARALIESFQKYSSIDELKKLKIAVIGPEAAKPLKELGLNFVVAPEATFEGLEEAVKRIIRGGPGESPEER